MRMTEQFIYWVSPEPETEEKRMIEEKVLGTKTQTH